MSIATDVRTYADLAVAQGKTALTQASQLLAAANKRLVADAPKPAYAALGAADLVAAAVTKRVEDLPVDAVNGVSKAQQTSQTLITRAQADANAKLAELRSRVEAGIETVTALPTTAKTTGETYLSAAVAAGQAYVSTAKNVYGSLTDRGAAKAAQLQHDPRVAKLFGQLSEAGDSVVAGREVGLRRRDHPGQAGPQDRRAQAPPPRQDRRRPGPRRARPSPARPPPPRAAAAKSSRHQGPGQEGGTRPARPPPKKAPAKKA